MLAVLIASPLIGWLVGHIIKTKGGFVWGLGAGILNWSLWRIYNQNVDAIGLDTVKNLLVNLGLFIVVGLVLGLMLGISSRRKQSDGNQTI